MDGRVRREAISARLSHTRQIAACVTDQPVRIVGTDRRAGGLVTIAFASVFTPVRLQTAKRERLGFAFSVEVRYTDGTGESTVGTEIASYLFRLVDEAGREVLVYHWHPMGISPIRFPHLHISGHLGSTAGTEMTTLGLSGFHLPTGHVTLANVVRFLITELGVVPRRDAWPQILGADDV